MLKTIILENFRNWEERVEVPLKPLTLLYGPNSAGKSSLFCALKLVIQSLKNAKAEIPFSPVMNGNDLGDFVSLVSRHDKSRVMTIGIEASADYILDEQGSTKPYTYMIELDFKYNPNIETKGIICGYRLCCSLLNIFFDDRSGALTLTETSKHEIEDFFNTMVPEQLFPDKDLLKDAISVVINHGFFWFRSGFPFLVNWEYYLKIVYSNTNTKFEEPVLKRAYDQLVFIWNEAGNQMLRTMESDLNEMKYIGPLRRNLDRVNLASSGSNCGLNIGVEGEKLIALLNFDRIKSFSGPTILSRVNRLLKKIKFGYNLKIREHHDISVGTVQWLVLKQESDGTLVNLRDVGSGISQLLPIIVQIVSAFCGFICIEQPELHLHPRMQLTIGQIFVECLGMEPFVQVICETHSPEILLRVISLIAQKKFDHENLEVCYIHQSGSPRSTETGKFEIIRVDKSGAVLDDWPDGFFQEKEQETRRFWGM